MKEFNAAEEVKDQLAREMQAAQMVLENEIKWLEGSIQSVKDSLQTLRTDGYYSQDLNIAARAAAVQVATARVEQVKSQQDFVQGMLDFAAEQKC